MPTTDSGLKQKRTRLYGDTPEQPCPKPIRRRGLQQSTPAASYRLVSLHMSLKSRVAARLDASYAKRHEYEELQRIVEKTRETSAEVASELATARSKLDTITRELREQAEASEEALSHMRQDVAFLRHQMAELARLAGNRE